MGKVLRFDLSKKKISEKCRFFKKIIKSIGTFYVTHRLCGAQPLPKKLNRRGIMQPWKQIGNRQEEGYFVRDEEGELAFERCCKGRYNNRCSIFKLKFPNRFYNIKREEQSAQS